MTDPWHLARRGADRVKSWLWRENWQVGLIDQPIAQAINWPECPKVRWLGRHYRTHYYADPMAWPGNPDRILCERYDFDTFLGHLVELDISGDEPREVGRVKLPIGGHLSFPFLFVWEGRIHCLPESSAAGCLALFTWESEAAQWKLASRPLPGTPAADAYLFRHEGRFWIGYTDVCLGSMDNLNLIYADTLDGPWLPHAGNPVRTSLSNARGAGGVFTGADGKLYRPAQDCVATYGAAIRLMRIDACTPNIYSETEISCLRPRQGANPHGLHTLSPCGQRTLVDGKRMELSLMQLWWKLCRRLSVSQFGPFRHPVT